jgi:hypothetical protein
LTQDFGAQLGLYPATYGMGFPIISGISLSVSIGSGGSERDGGHSIDSNLRAPEVAADFCNPVENG